MNRRCREFREDTMKPTVCDSILTAFVLLLVSLGCQISARAQPILSPPDITSVNVQTIGGVTYSTFTAQVQACYQLIPGPVMQSGTNLQQMLDQQPVGDICICDIVLPCPPSPETHVSVLGALPPGQYGLSCYATSAPFPVLWPLIQLPFTVPDPTPTLQCSIGGSQFSMTVAGISNVDYVIEASGNLSNWTAVATNHGGPFTVNIPVAGQQQYYRVRIVGN